MSVKKKPKEKPYRIFELTIVRAWLIFGVLFAHILMFVSIYYNGRIWDEADIPQWIGKILSLSSFESGGFMMMMWLINLSLMFFTQGITLSFSRHNGKRAFSIFMIFLISMGLMLIEWVIYVIFDFSIYYDMGLVITSFSIFGVYALCILLFKYITKLPFNFQFSIFIILLIPSLLSLYYFSSPVLNPLQWFNITLSNVYLDIMVKGFFHTATIFPYVACFSLGTLVGQIYYRNKISPFVTEKYSNFMQKHRATQFVLWSGNNTGKIFILHWWFLPLFFFLLTLLIMHGLPPSRPFVL